jgi:hypothetical protein
MPTRRMRLVRRRHVELPPACWRYLCDLQEPGDAGSDAMVGFEYFGDPVSIEEAWQRYGKAAIEEHQAARGMDSWPDLYDRLGWPGDDGGGEAA